MTTDNETIRKLEALMAEATKGNVANTGRELGTALVKTVQRFNDANPELSPATTMMVLAGVLGTLIKCGTAPGPKRSLAAEVLASVVISSALHRED